VVFMPIRGGRRYEDYKPEFVFYKLVLILYVLLYCRNVLRASHGCRSLVSVLSYSQGNPISSCTCRLTVCMQIVTDADCTCLLVLNASGSGPCHCAPARCSAPNAAYDRRKLILAISGILLVSNPSLQVSACIVL
jgi:hypothetical protein